MNDTHDHIRDEIRRRFVQVALSPQEERKFPVGPASAKRLGYDPRGIDALPGPVTESFAGVGNPFALGDLRAGQAVLDLGCGAGFDSVLAARRVGPSGRVIGVDFAAEMVEKARRNAAAVGVTNTAFTQGESDALPVESGSVDVVISNGVFNLCLDKPKVLGEVFRVLKPGGRVQMADILLHDDVTPQEVADKGTWSDWISGAVWGRSLLRMLEDAGFTEATFHGWTGYRTSSCTEGGLVTARRPVAGDLRATPPRADEQSL